MRLLNHMKLIIYVFLVISFYEANCQNIKIADSIKDILSNKEIEDDSILSKYYYLIARYSSDPIEIEKYAKLSLDIAVKKNDAYRKGLANYNLGQSYKMRGDISKALEHIFKSLKQFKEVNNMKGIMGAYNTLGTIYIVQENYKQSIRYLQQSIDISRRLQDTTNIAGDYNNIGEAYRLWGKLDSALINFQKSYDFYKSINSRIGIAYTLGNIGLVHAARNKYDSAKYFIDKATVILEELGDRYPISVYQTYLADIYKNQGDWKRALNYAHNSLQIAKEEGLKEQIRDASKKLAELYKDIEDYENAFQYQSQYLIYRDSINNEETIRKMADLRTEYEVSQKQAEVELLSERQRTQQIITISLSIVLFLVAVIAFIWYQNSQSRKRTNKLLSEQKEEIESQRDKLEEMVKMKDRFFGIISHDLRSPVNSLQGLSKLMSHYVSSKQYEELDSFTHMMDQSINNLSSLVDNLLNWAMSQQGDLPYYPQRIKLYFTVEEVCKIFTNLAQAKHIDLQYNVPRELEVWADRDGLFALLRNLVNNAIKFTPENGKVCIHAEENNTHSYIKVEDTGNGIPSEKIDQLFVYDKNKSTKGTAGEKGSGLGLALCKELVEINHGDIDIISKSGKGTTFTIKLPLKPIEDENA